jgi:predicted DCC family thiol-disulfide oxidoreductase YuxK
VTVRPVLLYDAACRVCRFAARSVVRIDRRRELAVLPLQDDEAATLLAELPEDERLASWRLVSPDGSIVGYGAGLPRLLAAMRLTRPVARALRIVPPRLLDRVYRAVAGNRGRVGWVAPDGPAPRRFP